MKRNGVFSVSSMLFLVVLVLAPRSARAAERLIATITVDGNPLRAFDISWVNQPSQTYYLADRSNARIDIINAETNAPVGSIGGFVGVDPRGNDFSGPNGVVVIQSEHELWAGDGRSNVKVIDLRADPPQIVDNISTGGSRRADELAFDQRDHVILIANDADDPPFVTFISTDTREVLQPQIFFPEATNGLEQPVWDQETHFFYLSVPQVGDDPADGEIAVIDPETRTVVDAFPVSRCQPAGLALGPSQHLLVGCSKDAIDAGFPAKTIILNARTGATVATIMQVGGSDEVWFNPGDDRYYLAARGNPGGPVLGIIDAVTNTWVQNVPTAPNAHSVAVDRVNNHAFVPLTPNAACTRGCIGVYANE